MIDAAKFLDWLRDQGAEVLAPTNPYEVARFRARGGVHIVYRTQHGKISAAEFPERCIQAFRNGRSMDMGVTAVPRDIGAKYRAALFERDGRACFYCLADMPNDVKNRGDLIPVSKGGPNHLENMVLAHARCNQAAGSLPVRKKIESRVEAVVAKVCEQAGI